METTREKAKQLAHDETVSALNQLLEKNYDTEQGYKNALLETNNERLKLYFKRQAASRSRNANELDKAIRDLNETPVKSGSTEGAIHRTWMDFKTAIVGKDDEAILEECIRGDEAAVSEYQDILDNQNYLHETKDVLRYQLDGIQNTLNTIKKLEDIID